MSSPPPARRTRHIGVPIPRNSRYLREPQVRQRDCRFRGSHPGKLSGESEPGKEEMPERNWSQPDSSTQENRTEDALSDADALRAELGAFLYPVVSYQETES